MPQTSMKAVITNNTALTAKYGAAGVTAINKALARLITADNARGISTVIFDIADPAQMAAVGGAAVLGPKDDRGAKVAVDAIHAKHTPDYIMLLDGPDVVPHVELNRIPGVTDADTTTDSDLPYASSAAYSKQASAYLAVTRVVGRLPAARGETDPKKLTGLIDASIAHATRPATDFSNYFAITADKWKVSTQMSLGNVFGGHAALFASPADGHVGIDPSLSNAAHFINCHGASGDWRFYGEQLGKFPIAMETPKFAALTVGKDSVVAAECCYGAQLYDYRLSGTPEPLCLTYLWQGACAVMGSTNIAYGPAAGNGQADFMAQYFLQEILKGASTGRALLQARQAFVQNQTMSSFLNLKTLAQFLLLGDPSLHPVVAAEPHSLGDAIEDTAAEPKTVPAGAAEPKTFPAAVDVQSERRIRRSVLDSEGKALASSASKPGRRSSKPSPAVERFAEVAREQGFKTAAEVYTVSGGADFKKTAKAFNQQRQVAIVMDEKKCLDETGQELFVLYRAMVGNILGDGVFSIEECESR